MINNQLLQSDLVIPQNGGHLSPDKGQGYGSKRGHDLKNLESEAATWFGFTSNIVSKKNKTVKQQ